MKKLVAFAIMAMFGCSITLFAKDVQVEPEKGAVITVWESEGAEGDFIKYAAKEFEKEYAKDDVKVKYLNVESKKTVGKMQVAVQGGAAADIFVCAHDALGSCINSGIIMPNLVSADKIRKEFLPAAVSAVTYKDGKLYGFPLAIETYAMFYNKKLLKTPPQTFEELFKVGVPFTDRSNNKYGLYYDIANFYNTYAFLAMDGGYVFGDNGYNKNDIGLNNKGAVSGLEALITLKPMSVAIAPDKDKANAPMIGLFTEGKVMTIITGPWDIPRLTKTDLDFGIVPLPTFKGKHPKSFSGIRMMCVNPASKYKKAAQLFAAFCTTPEMLMKRFEMTNQIPPVISLLKNPKIDNNPLVEPFLEQAEYSEPMPSIPEMKLTWDPMLAAVADAWAEKATPKAALDNAVNTIKQQIKLQDS